MGYRLSENLQREWDNDPSPGQLWDAVKELERDPSIAVPHLEALAGRGSPLAMMYLGDLNVYGRGGLPVDKDRGEKWLERSARVGSIEGGFRFANFLTREERYPEALEQWQKLGASGYAPAIFYLGYCHYKGHLGLEVDVLKAHAHWKEAYRMGHLHSATWLASSYAGDELGSIKWIAALWIRMKAMVPFVWHFVQYPTSDRLRLPWRLAELEARLDDYDEEHGMGGVD